MRRLLLVMALVAALPVVSSGQTVARSQAAGQREPPSQDVLSPAQWRKVDDGVDRGLAYLASLQLPDGSIPTFETGQPAVTSLAVMAFLSRGHCPGEGPYGATIDRAIDYVLAQQRDDGLLYSLPITDATYVENRGSHTATYNHAIAGLMLGEAFGMTDKTRAKKLRPAIERAIDFSRQLQGRPSRFDQDKYGWRYLKYLSMPNKGEADLSVTAWFIMFFRSAKNAEFDIPQEYVNDAIKFVNVCYRPQESSFVYGPYPGDALPTRAMNGAGIICLTLSGNYDDKTATEAGQWILARSFTGSNYVTDPTKFYFYDAYYSSQAMFLLGGEYWRKFYPSLADTLLEHQTPQGFWQPRRGSLDKIYGSAYTTALAILSLTPPYQLLPIYQR